MKIRTIIGTAALALGASLALVPAPAYAAGDATCGPISYSADGHRVSVTCTSGSYLYYGLNAKACSAGGCTTVKTGPVTFGATATLNAGSNYIASGSAAVVGYYS